MRLLIGTVLASVCLLVPAGAGAGERDILTLGQRLVAELPSPTPANAYGAPALVTWAGLDGFEQTTHRARCASLITQLLRSSRGYSSGELKSWFGSASPTAAQYRIAIASTPTPALNRIGRIADLTPGDIVAIEYANEPDGDDTGHMVMVAGAPQPTAGGPALDGTTQYAVEVIDATKSPHGSGDTRRYFEDGAWKSQPGVGRGRLRLYASLDGSPAGYTWSMDKGSELRVVADRPIELARPTSPTPPETISEPPSGDSPAAAVASAPPVGVPPVGAARAGVHQQQPSAAPGAKLSPELRAPVTLRVKFAARRMSVRALRKRRALRLQLRSTQPRSVVAVVRARRGKQTFVLARRRVALPPNRTVSVRIGLLKRRSVRLRPGTLLTARLESTGRPRARTAGLRLAR